MTPQEERLKAKLEDMGIQVKAHAVEESPFFYDWELRYAFVRVQRRNIDQALLDFVSELLRHVPVEKAQQAKPETSYLDDPTRVERGWLGDTYDESGQKIAEYNRQMDERAKLIREGIEKPWLPLDPDE